MVSKIKVIQIFPDYKISWYHSTQYSNIVVSIIMVINQVTTAAHLPPLLWISKPNPPSDNIRYNNKIKTVKLSNQIK